MPKMRKNTRVKYRALQRRYNVLYQEKRIRHDDVVAQLCKEFFLSEDRVHVILRIDLDEEEEEEQEACNIRSS